MSILHLHGIPYYRRENILYQFMLKDGQPHPDCVALGEYDGEHITYYPDWKERVKPHLDAFQQGVIVHQRNAAGSHSKPIKQRVSQRAPRRSSRRAKDPESDTGGH